ncbi:peroxisomal ABC transporter 1 [Actinidia rufa]|uniref:Peroxisomal ABC transporter 1 n=1 Tax=Actinidia rufa TaxID=165716 RepID=A0A7J0EZI8_9ERIC|nr:peroxisomal ABC transporter 1 [Actinidia rufa]
MGPNGSGKSSLFRVLGGLWPLLSGHIVKPGVGSDLNKEIFYVPQRPYMAVGTLHDQLIYPLTADQGVEQLTHDEMVELLKYVDLEYLLDRYPLKKEINWGDELSLGEQQRLGMARLFYHKPKFAILDECTSSVTTDMEERFCARVRAMGMSCITISHRPALVAFHDVVLSLDGEGGWNVHHKREDSSVHTDADGFNCKKLSETGRQNDAMAVQQAFADIKKDSSFSNAQSQSYISELIATSPCVDHDAAFSVIPQLQFAPRSLPSRVTTLFKVLVPTAFDKQGAQILAVAVLLGLTSWLSDKSNFLQGNTTKHVLEQDSSSYIRLFGASILLNGVSSFISPSLRHLTSKLALEWRIRLTQHLSKNYFRKNAYYKVFNMAGTNVDADQRITQDLEKLTTDLSGLVTGMVKPSVDMLWLTWRMHLLTGQRGVAILYAYMVLGLGFLKNFTPDFGDLASREQQLEGSFRFMHERLRSHAESVAFFGGGAREKAAGGWSALWWAGSVGINWLREMGVILMPEVDQGMRWRVAWYYCKYQRRKDEGGCEVGIQWESGKEIKELTCPSESTNIGDSSEGNEEMEGGHHMLKACGEARLDSGLRSQNGAEWKWAVRDELGGGFSLRLQDLNRGFTATR